VWLEIFSAHKQIFKSKGIKIMQTVDITPIGQGKHFLVGNDVVTLKATGLETSGNMLVMEVIVPSGGGPPSLHRHHYSEVFSILEGEFEITTLDANQVPVAKKVTAGDTVAVASLVWHNFKNVGGSAGKFTVVHSSTIMENFVLELGVPILDPLKPPRPDRPPSPEDMQNMMRVILKYMELLPAEKVSS
jgi:mannose-6-phosphate isomerase-like protein (cupin superfamily)